MKVKDILKNGYLLLDGGMGTYYSQLKHASGRDVEKASLTEPDLIRGIHTEYLEAGSRAIQTNTFAANRVNYAGQEPMRKNNTLFQNNAEQCVEEIITASWNLAAAAAEPFDAAVFADIGPISHLNETVDPAEELIFVADRFLALGAENFLFETQSNTDGLKAAAEHIKALCPEAFIITSFAVQADGFTREGIYAQELIHAMKACPAVDAIGFNCVSGARHMLELVQELDTEGITLSCMPNAGYPTILNNRTFYEGDPVYFASQLAQLRSLGAVILGGCCGTTPVHIELAGKVLEEGLAEGADESTLARIRSKSCKKPEQNAGGGVVQNAGEQIREMSDSPFYAKLLRGEKVVAVELDPPSDVTLTKFMSGAWELKGAGADILTVADCPIGRARMDASLLVCKIRRELNMDAIPHMTCRDRNLNATKALLLGLYAEGVRNVLLVTGDPIPTADRDEVKTVFQFNSRKLASFVTTLGKQQLPGPFHLFGALNVNARNFDVQLKLAKEKLESGMVGFLTQPVLTEEAFENLKRARKELPNAYILGGIIPVTSAKNGRFMNSEVNGINVDEKVIEMYDGLKRKEAEDLAVEISTEVAKRIAEEVDGYYIITPFQRTGLVSRILKKLKENEDL